MRKPTLPDNMEIKVIHCKNKPILIDKTFLLNPNISLEAKGLFGLIAAHDLHNFNPCILERLTPDGKDVIESALKELSENGIIQMGEGNE